MLLVHRKKCYPNSLILIEVRRFKKILIPAGFEPAPPKRSGPRPDALDHSARVPIHLLGKGIKQTQFIKGRYAI